MNIETFRPENAAHSGFLLTPDTHRPLFEKHHSDGRITEVHGAVSPRDLIKKGPFSPDRFHLQRVIGREGELISWGLNLYPVLSDETRENLAEVAIRNSERLGYVLALTRLQSRIPHIELGSDNPSVNIKFSGIAGISISEDNSFRVPSGEVAKYADIPIPIHPRSFFYGISDADGMMPAVSLRLPISNPITTIREKMVEIIQNGTFSEKQFRKMVNICFDLVDTWRDL